MMHPLRNGFRRGPSQRNSQSRVELLSEARNLIIRARAIGVQNEDNLLRLQYEIEQALGRERRERSALSRDSVSAEHSVAEVIGNTAADVNSHAQDEESAWEMIDEDAKSVENIIEISMDEIDGDEVTARVTLTDLSRPFLARDGHRAWQVEDWNEALGLLGVDSSSVPEWPGSGRGDGARIVVGIEDIFKQFMPRAETLLPEESADDTVESGNRLQRALTDNELGSELLRSERPSPSPPPSSYSRLQREDTSISSEVANAGSAATEEYISPVLTKEGQLAFHNAKRGEMLDQMGGDRTQYSLEREREFGREHGYYVYPPAELQENGNSDSDDELSEDIQRTNLPPRRARGGARSSTAITPRAPERNLSGDPRWFQNSIGAFAEYLARNEGHGRGTNRSKINSQDLAGQGRSRAPSQDPESRLNHDVHLMAFRREYASWPGPEAGIILIADEDGIDAREGLELLYRWEDFLYHWTPPFPDSPGAVPQQVRMLWHALSTGWGSWTPSDAMVEQIGYLIGTTTHSTPSQARVPLVAPTSTSSRESTDAETIAAFYQEVLDGFMGVLNEGVTDSPELDLISRMRESDLSQEEREIFIAALCEGIPVSRLRQIFQNWVRLRDHIEETRLPSERILSTAMLQCGRLEAALRIENALRSQSNLSEAGH